MAQEETRYERNPDYIYRNVVGEAVLVPIRKSVADMDCIYTLNPVGALIWERLASPATAAELEEAVLEEFESDRETVAGDLSRFLKQLEAAGAVWRT